MTAVDAVKAALAEIKKQDEVLNSFVTVDEEGALKRAEEVQKHIDDGEADRSAGRRSHCHQGQHVYEGSEDHLLLPKSCITLSRPILQRL